MIYERSAIATHLQRSHTDPLTRQPLPNASLTPVFPLRSRALEYRQQTAAACMEIACSPGCTNPVRYVRRAAEMVGDIDTPTGAGTIAGMPHGLSPAVVQVSERLRALGQGARCTRSGLDAELCPMAGPN
jgi:hypothetical protein